MAVRQRGTSWVADITINGKREQRTTTSRELAELAEAELRLEMLKGSPQGSASVWTLGAAYDKCYESVWRGSRGERMAKLNASKVLKFFDRETPVTSITTAWVDDFASQLIKGGASNGTVNRYLAVVSKLLSFCLQRSTTSGLTIKPYIERKREPEGRIVQVTRAEEIQIYAYLHHIGMEEQAAAFSFMIDTGARVGDMQKVTVEDINAEGRVVLFRIRKNGHSSGIPLTARALEIAQKRAAVVKTGKLWPFAYWWYRSAWARVVIHMGKEHDAAYVVHGLRHTTASRMVQGGVSLRVVQEFMGHRDIKTTMRYAHLAPAGLNAGRDMLEKALEAT